MIDFSRDSADIGKTFTFRCGTPELYIAYLLPGEDSMDRGRVVQAVTLQSLGTPYVVSIPFLKSKRFPFSYFIVEEEGKGVGGVSTSRLSAYAAVCLWYNVLLC